MKLSVKSDYAARAVLGLARHNPSGRAVKVEGLAAEQGVPANYLVQILIELKAQGIARSVSVARKAATSSRGRPRRYRSGT